MRSDLRRHVLALSCSTVLALAVLSGCSEDDAEDSADTGTAAQACRSYLLTVGREDLQAVLLVSRAERSGSFTPDDIAVVLDTTIAATTKAGSVEGLPDKDFARFLAVADAAHDARVAVTTTDVGFSENTARNLNDAVNALREACKA